MLKLTGRFRVQSIFPAKDGTRSYITLKDKETGAQLKVTSERPLGKGVLDDALVSYDGTLTPRVFGVNLQLTLDGDLSPVAEK